MTSVERMLEYANIDSEAATSTKEDEKLPKLWPLFGGIQVKGVSMNYYKDGGDVLKNISFDVKPKEKVQICLSICI